MTPYLEIVQTDGSAERYPLGGSEHMIVGRQPREGIALPGASELEAEHLRLTPRQDGCWLSVSQGARVPALVGGRHYPGGLLPWGSEIQLGSLWLRVTDGIPDGARTRSVGGAGMLAVLGLVGVGAWLFLSPTQEELPEMTSAQPPALFASGQPACPEADPAAAGPRAREAAEAARAKSERYPFAAQDGIRAVELYSLASRCFGAAGRDGDAERAGRDRAALVARIDEDYRTHRLKLERALEYGRTRQALLETRELLALVSHLDHPYTAWLRSVERRISLKTRPQK
ncbi:MAG TPA: FHA domain-containing protein [Kofleriaceae bacterium]|nr:FHA domain-containing protein [Kofleriaceae bacterium]